MSIPVPVVTTALPITSEDNAKVEDFVAKLAQVFVAGTSGVTISGKDAASPVLVPGINTDTTPAYSMATEQEQNFYRQLGFALVKSNLLPAGGGGSGTDLPDATTAARGAVSTSDQTFAGTKTFQDGVAASTVTATGAITAGSVAASGAVNAASVSAASLTASAGVSAATVAATTTVTAADITASNSITTPNLTIGTALTAPNINASNSISAPKVSTNAVTVANYSTNVKAYGAVGDGVTDDLAAFNAAIAASGTGSNGATIDVPNGVYYLSGPLHINKAVILKGPTPQRYGTASCELKFPAGSDGVILEASFSGTSGANAALKCLTIAPAGKTTAAYGVRFLQTGLVENCYISGWKTNGIIIDSTVVGSNCNSFVIRDTAVDGCDGDGVRITGADSNQGILQHVSSRSNGGWGFHDTSLTSSTYLNCHTETNAGGSYRLSNSGAGGVLVNCYAEGGQPAPEVHPPAVIVGGTWGTANPYDASLYVSKVSPTYGLKLGGGGGGNGSIVETPILGGNFATTMNLDLTTAFLYPYIAANTVATATPCMTGGTAGQRITIYNNTIYTVTLQDNATLPGSGLTLKTPQFVMYSGDSISFICLGGTSSWVETTRTIGQASTTKPGIVNTTTQTFAGAKTFQDSALAPVPFNPGGATSPIITLDHEDYIRPESYGALGDGVTDDYVALQAAINAAVTAKKQLRLRAKTYCTSQELVTTAVNHFSMVGAPMVNGVASTIKAIAPMRAILLCKLVTRLSQIAFDGGSQAQSCLYLQECSLAQFDHLSVSASLADGIFVAGEKDSTHFCSSSIDLTTLRFLRAGPMIVRNADRSPQTGTCSVTSGSGTITFSGAPNLTTLSPTIVGGRVIVKNGTSNVFYGTVQSCTSNTVTVPVGTEPTFTASGCEFVFCQGLGAISDTNSFFNVGGGGCGTLWAASSVFTQYSSISGIVRNNVAATTVGVTTGSTLVTFTGSGMDLWAANIREGDLMFIGDGAQRRMVMVSTVPTPTTLYTDTIFDYTASGLSWAIGHGAGYHEARNADANINSFSGTALWRGCAGAAMEFAGFYGPKVDGYQIDYCGMAGMRVGLSVCIGAILNRTYVEACGPQAGGVANAAWTRGVYLSSVQGILINMPLNGGNNLAENVQYSAMTSSGIYTGRYGQEPIGSFGSSVPASVLANPVVSGPLTLGAQYVALNHPHTTTIALSGNIVNLDAGVTDTTVSGVPLLSGPQGIYVLRMHLPGTAAVTFSGAGAPGTGNAAPGTYFQGSNVFFAAPCTIRAGDYVVLYGDGSYFFEICRGNRSNPLHDYSYSGAAPTTGLHQRGEVAWNSLPGSNTSTGWICTATGTPGTWKPIDAGVELRARDYGVKADGTTDDAAALQAAITDAISLKRPLRLDAGVHKVLSRIDIPGQLELIGRSRDGGGGGTVIKAFTALPQMVLIEGGSFSRISGIEFDGNSLATIAVRLTNCSHTVFERCRFTNALRDGVRLSRYQLDNVTFALSDSNHFINCDGYRNGVLYATSTIAAALAGLGTQTSAVSGSVSCTAGSNLITGSGTSFTTLNLRTGDFIRIGSGASPQYLQIDSVTDNTHIVCGSKQNATQTLTTAEYAIGAGSGYFEEVAPDANHNHITGGLWRSNAGAAIQIGGLYGALIEHPQIDTGPFYGISIGFSNASTQTYDTSINHPYFEGLVAAPIYFGAAYGVTITQPMTLGSTPTYHMSSATFNTGTWTDDSGIAPIGGATNRMPSTSGYNFATVGRFSTGEYYALSSAPASTVIDSSGGSFAIVAPNNGADATLSASPVLSVGLPGQIVTLYNSTAYKLTIESVDVRAGSQMQLRTPTIVLAPKDTLTVQWYDNLSAWLEIARSTDTRGAVGLVGGIGSGATDIVTKIGTTLADGSMHASSKLTSFRVGIGGTEVEKGWMRGGGGVISGNMLITANAVEYGTWAYNATNGGFMYLPAAGMLAMVNTAGSAYLGINLGNGLASCTGTFQSGGNLYAAGALGIGASGVVSAITDTTASPGNATINAGKGRAALANGATSVVITNSYVTTNSVVPPIWEDDPGQPWTVTVAAGSFTITTSAAVTGNKKFRFIVVQ